MKNLAKIIIIVLIYSTTIPNYAHAQLQINPTGSYMSSVEKGSSLGDGMWGIGVTIRYFVKPNLAVGVNGRYFRKSSTLYFGTESVINRNRLITLTGHIEYFLTRTKFRPYIGIESGFYRDSSTDETSGRLKTYYMGNYFGGAPKIGFQYSIIPNIGINLDAGYHFIVDGNTPSKSVLLSGGAFFTLGSK